jgi:hypothetical protein
VWRKSPRAHWTPAGYSGAAGKDRHPGAVDHERRDQSQAETTASASDDDIPIFE